MIMRLIMLPIVYVLSGPAFGATATACALALNPYRCSGSGHTSGTDLHAHHPCGYAVSFPLEDISGLTDGQVAGELSLHEPQRGNMQGEAAEVPSVDWARCKKLARRFLQASLSYRCVA